MTKEDHQKFGQMKAKFFVKSWKHFPRLRNILTRPEALAFIFPSVRHRLTLTKSHNSQKFTKAVILIGNLFIWFE